ncbi:zinc finger protein 786-like [Phlebotomus argentipes]|uniref:zinc finger protein 786-like n=1 Tax=Phlebotomus argentipes TaxID=94469 RepID=UPI002892A689|nr:zinc finger protein 786-like [Phlebotomus argentipes]
MSCTGMLSTGETVTDDAMQINKPAELCLLSTRRRNKSAKRVKPKPSGGKSVGTVPCACCRKRVVPQKLESHMKMHAKAPFICSFCFCAFRRSNLLATHKLQCWKWFSKRNTSSSSAHQLSVLPDWLDAEQASAGRFPCPACSAVFHCLGDLLDHVVAHDSAAETLTCGPCSAIFFGMPDLKKHMFKHVLADQQKAKEEV